MTLNYEMALLSVYCLATSWTNGIRFLAEAKIIFCFVVSTTVSVVYWSESLQKFRVRFLVLKDFLKSNVSGI
jgi:hypothetical protein